MIDEPTTPNLTPAASDRAPADRAPDQTFTVAELLLMLSRLSPADKVVFYEDDGTDDPDDPDEWWPEPHLAIAIVGGQPWLWLHHLEDPPAEMLRLVSRPSTPGGDVEPCPAGECNLGMCAGLPEPCGGCCGCAGGCLEAREAWI